MRRSLFALIVALGLLPSAASSQEREWTFDTGEEDAYLIFGVPETDDVGVSFWCTLGMGEIRMFIPEAGEDIKADKTMDVEVNAGGKSFSLPGQTAVNEESGSTSVEVHLKTDSPFLAALSGADRFTVKVGNEESVFPLEGADFESLLRVCAHR